MFRIGDLVTCKKDFYYGYTNTHSLNIVAYIGERDYISVFCLESTDMVSREVSNENFLKFINNLNEYGCKTDSDYGLWLVDSCDFVETSLEEYEEHKRAYGLSTYKNKNYDMILGYYGIKVNETNKKEETTMYTPTIHTNGTYNFSEKVKESVISKMGTLLNKYHHKSSSKGLNKIWEVYANNKQGVAAILSQHKNWNPEQLAIIFSQNFTRSFSKEAVNDFCYWVDSQLYYYAENHSYKLCGMTKREASNAYAHVRDVYRRMCSIKTCDDRYDSYYHPLVHSVKVDGMTIEEWEKEKDRLEEICKLIDSKCMYINGNYVSKDEYNKILNATNFISYIRTYEGNRADKEFAEKANEYAKPFEVTVETKNGTRVKGLSAREGQKVSTIVKKFFAYFGFTEIVEMRTDSYYVDGELRTREKDYGWNGQFTKYADGITPLVFTRHTIISINPIDYLTMSFGNSWASCHTIDKKNERNRDSSHNYSGCYCSGTLSYMLDRSSVIMYTVDASYNGEDFCLEDKINRCVFCIGEDKILQSRLYPDGRSAGEETGIAVQFRNIMQKVVADCVGANNLWDIVKGSKACGDVTVSYGTHYNDYTEYDDGNVSYLKINGKVKNYVPIEIGHEPICPYCGDEHSRCDNLNCYDCRHLKTCEHCGDDINEDDAIIDVDTDNVYCCEECANANGVYYCNDDEWHSDSENVHMDNYTEEYFYDNGWDSVYIDRDWGYYYANSENAEADGWHWIESIDDWRREDEDDVIQCEDCGEWILLEDATEVDGYFYCSNCVEYHLPEEETA